MYIIGWRDLPAARRLVPVMDVLDYVSPRELEDWEQRLEEELDEAREKLEETKRLGEEQVDGDGDGESKSTAKVVPTDPKTGKRRTRSPPVHTQIELEAAVALDEEGGKSQGRLRGGTLSLSTPRKRRLKAFEELSDDGESSPSRQIERELYDEESRAAQYGPENRSANTAVASKEEFTGDETQTEEWPLGNDNMAYDKEGAMEKEKQGGAEDGTAVSAKAFPISSRETTAAAAALAWTAFGLDHPSADDMSAAAAPLEGTPTISLTTAKPLSQDLPSAKQSKESTQLAKPRKLEPVKLATKAKNGNGEPM
jgi:hypothetical protein